MSENSSHEEEYDDDMVAMLETIWGEAFMAPGGPETVRRIVQGVDLQDKTLLDVGCGLGGGDLILAGELGARVTGIDLGAPLLERARRYAAKAGLSERIEFRQVEPGPFPFADESFDVVYSCGAIIHMPDKDAMFAEIKRVLKPGGILVGYDWLKGPGPISADMAYWIELEGLSFSMETLEDYGRGLTAAGFANVETQGDGGWYARKSAAELEEMKGPLAETLVAALGQEKYEHFLEDWRMTAVVAKSGEMKPGYFRATKAP
ncbi:MAG: methyltransferase domain-containing protein [Pseudomonadota bacterium]